MEGGQARGFQVPERPATLVTRLTEPARKPQPAEQLGPIVSFFKAGTRHQCCDDAASRPRALRARLFSPRIRSRKP